MAFCRGGFKMAAAIATKSPSSFFWKRFYSNHSASTILYLNLRRICVATTVENERENLTPKEEEEKIRKREAGKQLHAVYHLKVNEIAKEFRVNRLEWEKNLTNEKCKKGDLRLLEKEIHDRVIESVKLENKRIQKLRWFNWDKLRIKPGSEPGSELGSELGSTLSAP